METALFIVTKDEFGNDQMWAGCRDHTAQWTLQVGKAFQTTNVKFALEMARQFKDSRIVRGRVDLGPMVIHDSNSQRFFIL